MPVSIGINVMEVLPKLGLFGYLGGPKSVFSSAKFFAGGINMLSGNGLNFRRQHHGTTSPTNRRGFGITTEVVVL